MNRAAPAVFSFVPYDELDDLPALDPVMLCEINDRGWRGLTAAGEVMDVQAHSGEPRATPGHSVVVINGKGERIGRRAMPAGPCSDGAIKAYLDDFNQAVWLLKRNAPDLALAKIEAAIAVAPTARARFNRSLILLSLARWEDGFADHEARFELMNPPLCEAAELTGMHRWYGADIRYKTLLLVHDAGFGDSIMMLRFVPTLLAMGINVKLYMPPELKRLAGQVAPVVDEIDYDTADYFCPMLSLFHLLGQTISVPRAPYLTPLDSDLARHRADICRFSQTQRIGIVWSVGRNVIGDYPRAISLSLLTKALRKRHPGAELYSLQKQDDTLAASMGVNVVPLPDFAECAALASLMDEIVTVDTAALHLAGAIGRPRITALLSHWASWRWREDAPLYSNVTLCRQDQPGDWESALAKLG